MFDLPSLAELRLEIVGIGRSAWTRAEFRRLAGMTVGILATAIVLCELPLFGGRPLFDVASGTTSIVSSILDALGVIHHVDLSTLVITQPGMAFSTSFRVSGLFLLVVLLAAGLGYSAWRESSTLRGLVHCVGAVGVTLITNVLVLLLILLAYGALDLNMATGIGWCFSFGLRVAIGMGLLYCLVRALNTAIAMWRFRWALSHLDSTGEIPQPVALQRRREVSIVSGLLVCVLGLWLSGSTITHETLITKYRSAASHALNRDNLDVASLTIDRLLGFNETAAPHQFLLAILQEAQGDADKAEETVRAIIDKRGREYPPAHRWLAARIAEKRSHVGKSRINNHDTQAVSRLTAATDLNPADINAHVALAEAYLARRSPQQAIRELEKVVDKRPDLRLTLARLHILAGHAGKGCLHGEISRDTYREQLRELPLSRPARIGLAGSLIFLEEFPEAVAVLLKGNELSTPETYSHGLGAAYLVWYDTMARSGADRNALLGLLEKSLEYTSDSESALRRLALLAAQEGRGGPAIDLLTRSLADQAIPASVHYVLGTNAFAHGRINNALRHLEEAHRLDPLNHETLNNLAWILSISDPPQLDRALTLSATAVAERPNLASLRETRGQILAKLERWPEAIADLENAMQVIREKDAIHATLAMAYQAIGDETLAAEHRKIADKLRDRK